MRSSSTAIIAAIRGRGRALGIPLEAVEVYLSCEVIDLLTASFVFTQVLPRYDLGKRHRPRLPRSAFSCLARS